MDLIKSGIYIYIYAAKSRLNCIVFLVLVIPPVLSGFDSVSMSSGTHDLHQEKQIRHYFSNFFNRKNFIT